MYWLANTAMQQQRNGSRCSSSKKKTLGESRPDATAISPKLLLIEK
jgi:hypothetical protein